PAPPFALCFFFPIVFPVRSSSLARAMGVCAGTCLFVPAREHLAAAQPLLAAVHPLPAPPPAPPPVPCLRRPRFFTFSQAHIQRSRARPLTAQQFPRSYPHFDLLLPASEDAPRPT